MLRPFHALPVLLLLCGAAEAQVTTYNYTGQPMMVTAAGPGMSSGQPNEITATITLAAPLGANAANQVVVPISYEFNGIALPNPAEWTNGAPPVFSFTTINGVIVAWNVSIDLGSANSFKQSLEITSSGAGDTYNFVEIVDTDQCNTFVQAPNCWIYDAVAYQRGVWVQQGQVPPITLTDALAEITTLQTQVTSLQSQITSLQSQLTTARGQEAYYLTGAQTYLNWLLESQQAVAIWHARALAVAKKCGCSW
jgi:hypothetical protein